MGEQKNWKLGMSLATWAGEISAIGRESGRGYKAAWRSVLAAARGGGYVTRGRRARETLTRELVLATLAAVTAGVGLGDAAKSAARAVAALDVWWSGEVRPRRRHRVNTAELPTSRRLFYLETGDFSGARRAVDEYLLAGGEVRDSEWKDERAIRYVGGKRRARSSYRLGEERATVMLRYCVQTDRYRCAVQGARCKDHAEKCAKIAAGAHDDIPF